MRDINRLDTLYDELKDLHRTVYDWRFGQLMSNFLGWVITHKDVSDIFFPEDDKWIKFIREYKGEITHDKTSSTL